jgi:16S rRNA (cytidine1402-2'-O)-methyltransferase
MPEAVLYVIATPIGNLEDLTARAARVLTEVDAVLAEDTRRSQKLLSHLNLRKSLIRCDEKMEDRACERTLADLGSGRSLALLSDAGTPLVSDPGTRLVGRVHAAGFRVIPIPGPSAVTTAISAAGFQSVPFSFHGFLPKKSGQRTRALRSIARAAEASVFFESPHRIHAVLTELARWAPDRGVCIGRELTKMHEEIIRGSAEQVAGHPSLKNPRGEFTVVVAGLGKKEIRQRRKAGAMMEDK